MRIPNVLKALFYFGLIPVFFLVAFRLGADTKENSNRAAEASPRTGLTSPAISAQATPDPAAGYSLELAAGQSAAVSGIADTRFLELVNHDYKLAGEPGDGLVVPAWPTVPVSAKTVTIHGEALQAVSKLFDSAREAYDCTFYISSGYRSCEEQKQVYDGASDKSFAQPPNHSEHQTGLAADIFIIGIGQNDMAKSREAQWLAENAWKYGLLLRYPANKQGTTGISYEPWHFRYIGRIHAWYCFQNDMCFEEYIQFLKEALGYKADLDGQSYTVSYQFPDDGLIYLPENGNYDISGDNTGGYIVTAWE